MTPDLTDIEAIRMVNTDSSDIPTAFAYFPQNFDGAGDAFFGNVQIQSPEAGNYGWHTILHELGHTLGLKHPHSDWNNGFPLLDLSMDSMEYSVMTYRGYVGASTTQGYFNGTFDYAQTWMMLDIRALQELYGADFSTNSGNTTYKWNPGSGDTLVNGQVAIDAGGDTIFATIWDGGGKDTYDLSAFSGGVDVDLRPGNASTFADDQLANLDFRDPDNLASGNLYIALQYNGDARSLIENAIGGSGNDRIDGNTAANKLTGNGGNDTLVGGNGKDKMTGGNGKDNLSGGGQKDKITGGKGNDTLNGGGGKDVIQGGVGKDIANGGGGADRFVFATNDLVDWSKLSGGNSKKYTKVDIINNFDVGADKLDFSKFSGVSGMSDLRFVQPTVGGTDYVAVIVDATGDRVLVETNLTANQFANQGDFIF